jgi:hypothetical protein
MALPVPADQRGPESFDVKKPDTWTAEQLAQARGGLGGAPVTEMAVPPPGRPPAPTSAPMNGNGATSIADGPGHSGTPPPVVATSDQSGQPAKCSQCRRPAKYGRKTCGDPRCVEDNRRATQQAWYARSKGNGREVRIGEVSPASIRQTAAVASVVPVDVFAVLAAIPSSLPVGWELSASAAGVNLRWAPSQ